MAPGPSHRSDRQRRMDAAAQAAAEVRRRAVASGVLVLIASLVVLFCCSRRERPPRSVPAPSASSAPPLESVRQVPLPPAPASGSAEPPPRTAGRLAPAASASDGVGGAPATLLGSGPAAGGASSGGSRIASAVAGNDPRDLALLSRIERELGQAPSPAVHAILRRRREGAPRAELLDLARALPELPLRVLVIRWLDEVSPAS